MIGVLLFSGLFYFLQDDRHEKMPAYSDGYTGTAVFKDGFKVDGDTLRGFMELSDGGLVYANYRFQNPEEKAQKEKWIGDSRLSITGVFEETKTPSHEFAFDMASYLKSNGASAAFSISQLVYMEPQEGFLAGMSKRRDKLKLHIRSNFPESLRTEAEALLIGEREMLTAEQQRIQQTLGISHLFAISGLHIGIISALLYFMMLRIGIRKHHAMFILLAVLPLYALLAGGAPSVWRAVSMTSAVLILKLMGTRIPIANILLLSFILFLFLEPYTLYKIGFQLSYGASFGIIYSMKLLEKETSPVKIGLMITFISQFTLYPLLLFHFYSLSLSSFAVNSLFVPLYTLIILPANLVFLFLTFVFPPAADFLFHFYEPFRNFIGRWTDWLAEWPHQMWIPGKPDAFFMCMMIIGILLFYSLSEKGFRWWKLGLGVMPAIVFTLVPYFDGALRVTFIDVGQGDSALVELPYRRGVYLVDTGGVLRFSKEGFSDRSRPFEVGRQVVAPYLHGNGISSIDALILSHPDADHAEGADEILELFRVAEIHMTPGSQTTDLIMELGKELEDAVIRLPGRGSTWQKGDTLFTYLSPADGTYEGNNDSLVLMMEQEGFKILFTGDLEVDGEEAVLREYGELLAGTTILKVGHHGSKTSSGENFLAQLNPELSIFSAGKDNRYGHPAEEVIERFGQLELPTMNTAEQGSIEIVFRNGTYSVLPMK